MGRTRSALLEGALLAVEKNGVRRATMNDVAALGGVAKATLYNHFRTKDDVLRAAAQAAVTDLARECVHVATDSGLTAALTRAATAVSESGPLRRIVDDESALAAVLRLGEGPVWDAARSGVAELLRVTGTTESAATVDVVLRWLLSHVASPATAQECEASARVLVQGLAGSGDTSS